MRRICIFMVILASYACTKEGLALKENSVPFLGQLEWAHNFGGTGDETAKAIINTADGGYAVVGYTNSIDGDITDKDLPVNDYWLLKLDADGNLQWSKTYGGSKDDLGQALVQTKDGGYALTGYAMSSDGDSSANQGFHDNWILRLTEDGEIMWEKSFGFSGHDHSYDILETQDEGYFFTGFLDITSARADGNTEKKANPTSHGVGEFWGTRITDKGELLWRGYFGGSNNDRAHAVVQANDEGFVMAGFSESDDYDVSQTKGSYDFWLIKVDRLGNLVWERSFGGTGIEVSYDIVKTKEGDYVVVGNTFSTDGDITQPMGGSDIWMIKVNDAGSLIWQKSFGGTDFDAAEAVIQSLDGGFYIVGNSKSSDLDVTSNAGENDIWVLKTDANGNVVWQEAYGGTGIDFAFDIVEKPDGSILIAGQTASIDFPEITSNGNSELILLKIR